MHLLHVVIVPLLFSMIVFYLHKKIESDWLVDIFRFFGFGIIFGFIINLIQSFVNSFFTGIAYPSTIIYKLILNYGLFFLPLLFISFYFIVTYLSKTGSKLSWTSNFSFCLSYLCGIFSFINMIQVIDKDIPSSFLFYLSYIPFILFVALCFSFLSLKYFDSVVLKDKIIFIILTFLSLLVVLVSYNYLAFYGYFLQYLFIFLFIVLAFIFDFFEFKYFRQRKS